VAERWSCGRVSSLGTTYDAGVKNERTIVPRNVESVLGISSVNEGGDGTGDAHLWRYIPAAMAERQKLASMDNAQRGRDIVMGFLFFGGGFGANSERVDQGGECLSIRELPLVAR